jgi:hypothetical protein
LTRRDEQGFDSLKAWFASDYLALARCPKDALHNSSRRVLARSRAVCGVAFIANSTRYWLQNAPSIPSRSALHPLALSYAEHPNYSYHLYKLFTEFKQNLIFKRA